MVAMVIRVPMIIMVVLCHGGDQALAGLRISIKGFPGRDIAESQDPRIFGTGLAWNSYPGILTKKSASSRDYIFS